MKRVCKDCGREFDISDSEIGFYNSKGYELPKRCKSCRDAKKGKNSATSLGNQANSFSGYSSSENDKRNSNRSNGNKTIGILIAAIVIVVMIGVVATVKSLSGMGNSDNDFVADTSGQTYVPDAGNNDDTLSSSDIAMPDTNNETIDTEGTTDIVDFGDDVAADTNEAEGATLETIDGIENSDSGEQQTTPEVTETTPEVTETTPEVTDTAPAQVTYYFRNSSLLNQHYEKHGIEMGFDSAESYQAAASAVINNPNALYKTEAEDGDGCFYVEATNEFVVLSTDGYIRTYFYPNSGKAYFDRQ